MYFSLNLSYCVPRYGHCQILARFTMPIHQIWSCQVPQVPSFEGMVEFCILQGKLETSELT